MLTDPPANVPRDVSPGKNKGPAIIIVDSAVTSLSSIFVLARLYVRFAMARKFYLDDYLITVALVS